MVVPLLMVCFDRLNLVASTFAIATIYVTRLKLQKKHVWCGGFNWGIFLSISHWRIILVQEAFYFFIYTCKSTSLVVDVWGPIFERGFPYKTNHWNLRFIDRNQIGFQSFWGVDNFKVLSLANGEHGLDYYCGEKLAQWLVCQFQTKFKLQAILESRRVFGRK